MQLWSRLLGGNESQHSCSVTRGKTVEDGTMNENNFDGGAARSDPAKHNGSRYKNECNNDERDC